DNACAPAWPGPHPLTPFIPYNITADRPSGVRVGAAPVSPQKMLNVAKMLNALTGGLDVGSRSINVPLIGEGTALDVVPAISPCSPRHRGCHACSSISTVAHRLRMLRHRAVHACRRAGRTAQRRRRDRRLVERRLCQEGMRAG